MHPPSTVTTVLPADRHRRRVLVTGGAGFVGASLALGLAARHPDWELIALDNLRRRGSELNLPRLREAGVGFVHGDVRELADLLALDPVDAVIECSAEPSALAGAAGDTQYVVDSNLVGARNCLELARRDGAQVVFLSTSRVYPFDALDRAAYREAPTRFELDPEQELTGVSADGVSEAFPLEGPRTLYGATKLAAELLVTEYGSTFGLATVIDRCGVIAGPWQMGTVDQGVFTYWALAHYFRRELRYIGYGGLGKQVRDLVHVDDLIDLIDDQLLRPDHWDGVTANAGGGREFSLSLLETTELCRELTGNRVDVAASSESRPGDVRIYVSDCARLHRLTDWRPQRGPRRVLEDTVSWIADNERAVGAVL
ncbi:MAG TPA: NAD-dependent epimerase/dehydratase family protein [Solirubrobacteraceae bacterium]|nr:NAD-dependent epimerase/dehydratase family protein [Solirubrobacteraceae bacterium]